MLHLLKTQEETQTKFLCVVVSQLIIKDKAVSPKVSNSSSCSGPSALKAG